MESPDFTESSSTIPRQEPSSVSMAWSPSWDGQFTETDPIATYIIRLL